MSPTSDLRLQIARLRRRCDGHVYDLGRNARRFKSWRTYVKSFPASAVLAAAGAGLAVSAGFGKRRLARWIGLRLIKRAAGLAGKTLKQEAQNFWAATAPGKSNNG
jgi:hypothetical protein